MDKNFAIVCISYPFGNPGHPQDLVIKTVHDIEKGYGLFADQFFTPTYIEDITNTIWKIHTKRKSGIFHIGCKGLVSRLVFDEYLANKLRLKKKLVVGSLEEFIKTHAKRALAGGFLTGNTEKTLGVRFHTWQDALKKATSHL